MLGSNVSRRFEGVKKNLLLITVLIVEAAFHVDEICERTELTMGPNGSF